MKETNIHLNGLRLERITIPKERITVPKEIIQPLTYSSSNIFDRLSNSLDIEIDVVSPMSCIDGVLESFTGKQFINLGNGCQCRHCGHYQPDGAAKCVRCQAPTDKPELMELPNYFQPSNIDWYSEDRNNTIAGSIDDYQFHTTASFLFSFYDECAGYEWVKLLQKGLFSHNVTFKTEYFLCQWCGMGVRDGQDCPGCGGTRLAYNDLIEINHNCLYCGGRANKGSIWCMACGARLSGKTLKQFLEEKG